MKIWKYEFTKAEVIKCFVIAYLPVVMYIFIRAPKQDFRTFVGAVLFALLFTYPIHLVINFRIKKLFKWFFIGFIPCFALNYIIPGEVHTSLFSSICWGVGTSGFMYPIIIGFINETKEYRELLRGAPLSFKIMVISSVVLMIARSVRSYLIHRG